MSQASEYAAAWKAWDSRRWRTPEGLASLIAKMPDAPEFERTYFKACVDEAGGLCVHPNWESPAELEPAEIPALIAWLRATFEDPPPTGDGG